MKFTTKAAFIILLFLTSFPAISQKGYAFKPREMYRSKNLIVTKLLKIHFNIPHLNKPMILEMLRVMASS
jgi:hypothetical protein